MSNQFKIRVFVRGVDAGCYTFETQAEAEDHYEWSAKKFSILGCSYRKEFPKPPHEQPNYENRYCGRCSKFYEDDLGFCNHRIDDIHRASNCKFYEPMNDQS